MDGYLDLRERQRAEDKGEHDIKTFGGITVKRYPAGRLEVIFPDGYIEPDLTTRSGENVWRLMDTLPELKDALIWAGWF